MSRSIFKETALNEAYEAQGYVVIRGFYAPEDVTEIRRVYEERFGSVERRPGMWCTQLARYGKAYDEGVLRDQKALEDALNGATLPKMSRYFDDARLLSGVVMDKFPGDETSECLPHRDWTMVDESSHEGWLIWSPLTPVTERHGRVYVLPGSHRRELYGIQAAITRWPYRDYAPIVKKYAREVDVAPGDALVYSNRVVHGSLANRTAGNRPVVTMGACSRSAPLWYCWKDRGSPDALVEIYEVPDDDLDFFYRVNHVDRPAGVKLVDRVPAGFPPYDAREFEAVCRDLARIPLR